MTNKQKNKLQVLIILGLFLSMIILYMFDIPGFNNEQEVEAKVYVQEITEQKVFDAVNKVRADEGLPLLTRNIKLDLAAKAKANDLVEKGYWSHTNPEGKRFQDFIKEQKYNYSYAGENLAGPVVDKKGNVIGRFKSVNALIFAWVASPSHFANIKNTNYKETGISVNGDIIVQEFGTEIK